MCQYLPNWSYLYNFTLYKNFPKMMLWFYSVPLPSKMIFFIIIQCAITFQDDLKMARFLSLDRSTLARFLFLDRSALAFDHWIDAFMVAQSASHLVSRFYSPVFFACMCCKYKLHQVVESIWLLFAIFQMRACLEKKVNFFLHNWSLPASMLCHSVLPLGV